MTNNLQKDIILNGQDSIAVFKDNGVVYRAADIESYTPIVFRNLKVGSTHQFELQSVISKNYRVIDMIVDVKGDDNLDAISDATSSNLNFVYGHLTIVKADKRRFTQLLNLHGGNPNWKAFLILLEDKIRITPDKDLNSVTLICQPVYLENTIVVPEVISNEPVDSGNENPSPEPAVA